MQNTVAVEETISQQVVSEEVSTEHVQPQSQPITEQQPQPGQPITGQIEPQSEQPITVSVTEETQHATDLEALTALTQAQVQNNIYQISDTL